MKIKDFVIYATTVALITSGTTFHLCKAKAVQLNQYIKSSVESIQDDDFQVTAHRGFSSLEVENTKEAISLAADEEYIDYIEIDARLTKDNKIVLSHNNALSKTRDYAQYISGLTYEEVMQTEFSYEIFPFEKIVWNDEDHYLVLDRRFQLWNRPFHLVGLQEGLKACKDKKILLDLKFDNNIEIFTNELLQELDGVDMSNVIVQSLDLKGIQYVQEHTPYNCLALINHSSDLHYMEDFENIGIPYRLMSPEIVEYVKDNDKMLAVWTINNTTALYDVIEKAGNYYKDIIYITDYPDLIVTRLHEKEDKKEKKLTRRYS